MGWNPNNWNAPNWDPGNWNAPTHTPTTPGVPVRSAFLDRFGRFAKRADDVAEIRLWEEGAAAEDYESMTADEFNALTTDEKDEIRNLGSGAGLVVTAGKSNA